VKTAMWARKMPAGRWKCLLCPHGCVWDSEAHRGLCRIRGVVDGIPAAMGYGNCIPLAVDPIEKKPLYHFLPGKLILSTGPAGCNLSCRFCQNWEISQGSPRTMHVAPEDLARAALEGGSCGIAFTYTEPVIWFEYISHVAPLVRRAGGAVVMVSNGYVCRDPLDEYIEMVDAWNVDLKGWSEAFYREVCGGERDVVQKTIKRIARSDNHLELTFLVVPGGNDDPGQWAKMAAWIADNAGAQVPLHISRYFPRYRMETPPTPVDTLMRAVEVFSEKLEFVYPGNLAVEGITTCPSCRSAVIRRSGYSTDVSGMAADGSCRACGNDAGIVTSLSR
jgi:pyruvate formate lyase activating enzyme